MMGKPIEKKIHINQLALSEELIFELVFKAVYPRLLAFSKKFVQDEGEAEDIVQEVFLKAWEKRAEIDIETIQPYLFTLVRNACLNQIKHQRIEEKYLAYLKETSKVERLYYADFFSDPLHKTIFNEVQSHVQNALNELPEQTRTVFSMSRFEGMKNTEIAEKLDISLRTVEKHNTKALRKMKDYFADYYAFILVLFELVK